MLPDHLLRELRYVELGTRRKMRNPRVGNPTTRSESRKARSRITKRAPTISGRARATTM